MEYRYFKANRVQFHAVRVDPSVVDLRVARPPGGPSAVATVQQLVDRNHALAGVNGTFFDEGKRSLGWLVSEGIERSKLRDKDWFAALLIRQFDDRRWAEVQLTQAIQSWSPEELRTVRFAIQVGPRTVVAGQPVKLKPQSAARTAACVLADGRIVLLVTQGEIEANRLAALMALPEEKGGFQCLDGLMFDGGPSTQMAVRTTSIGVDVPGGYGVPNAVIVVPNK